MPATSSQAHPAAADPAASRPDADAGTADDAGSVGDAGIVDDAGAVSDASASAAPEPQPQPAPAPQPAHRWDPPLVTRAEAALAAAALVALGAVVVVSQLLDPHPGVRSVAQFAHLACVVVGLGSVLAVDWFGLRWRLGRVSLESVVATAGALAVPIWLGLAGLLVSGMLLEPDLAAPLTLVKVAMVTATCLAGVLALAVGRRLAARRSPSPRLVRAGLAVAVSSQVAWWSAAVIGFLNRT